MQKPTKPPSQVPSVVALVCTTGGIEALVRVVAPLPPDLPAAIIVLQHQDSCRASRLADVLATRCALPVHVATGHQKLRAGTVTVIPEGMHGLVTSDAALVLISSGPRPPYRPSADLLLATLALAAGPRAIAVILPGSRRECATGATAVHNLGGTVIAAEPTPVANREMPEASIERDGVVDLVVPVDEIPATLETLITPHRGAAHVPPQ